MSAGPKTHNVVHYSTNSKVPVSPERLTEILIKEFRSTKAFLSVDYEGVGVEDVVVKPTLEWCTFTIFGHNFHNVFDLEMGV